MARYLANTNTKEIHDLEVNISSDRRAQCKLDEIKAEHKESIYSEGAVQLKLRYDGYNGCKWCLERHNTG